MAPITVEPAVRDAALAVLLRDYPTALLVAMTPDGFRVPLPSSVGAGDNQAIPVPGEPATMLDLILAADHWSVINAWDRAKVEGMTMTWVRPRTDPTHSLALSFIDVRHSHGVLVGALSEANTRTARAHAELPAALLVPPRPRTATVRKTYQAFITGIDDRTTRMLGWRAEQMVGRKSSEFLHPDDQERALGNWLELLSKRDTHRLRLRHRCADGSWLWTEFENIYHHAADPVDATVTTHITDISDEMAAHEAADRNAKLLRQITEALPIGLLQTGADGALTYANSTLAELVGVVGVSTVAEQLSSVTAADRALFTEALHAAVGGRPHRDLEITLEVPGSGVRRRCAVAVVAVTAEDGEPAAIACLTDITESARLRDELSIKATRDVLTGCHNRAAIIAALEQTLTSDAGSTAAIYLDLDGFKAINDTYGHAAGDELLVCVADRLRGVLRDDDLVGRLGGDEFLIVCRDLDEPEQAIALADRVHAVLHEPVTLPTTAVPLAASMGVAWSAPGIDADALIARADAAMYECKRQRQDHHPVRYLVDRGRGGADRRGGGQSRRGDR